MKSVRLRYLPLLLLAMLFIACKGKKAAPPDNNDPIFQTDPDLKKITDQISSSPDDATLYYRRGTQLRKMQLDSLALKDYKKASSLDTNKADYYSAVGDILFENKDISGSVEWIQKAIAKNPGDRKARLKIAKLFLYTKDYANAFAEVNKVLRKDVYDPEAYFLKGMLYKDMKDTAKAISNFLTAVQVSPDFKNAVIQLGLLYSAKKDPIALRYLDNAYQIDTNDVFPLFAKGVFYQNAKDYEHAKEQFRKCIRRDHQYVDAYFNMGYVLMQQDSTQKAWRQYDLVTKLDPGNPTAYYNRGLCSELMDSFKNAVFDYRQALRLDTAYQSPKDALRRLHAK